MSHNIPKKRSKALLRRIKTCIYYNFITGELTYIKIPRGSQKKIGDTVGQTNNKGYLRVSFRLKGKYITVFGHNIAWFLKTGVWPTFIVDHKDRNPANNRWRNLRASTGSQNQQNRGLHRNSTTKVTGVTFNKAEKVYVAYIYVNKKYIYLGRYKTLKRAKIIRRKAERKYHKNYSPRA